MCPQNILCNYMYIGNYLPNLIWSILTLYFVIVFCHTTIYYKQPFVPQYPPGTQQETDGALKIRWVQKGLFTKGLFTKVWVGSRKSDQASRFLRDNPRTYLLSEYHIQCNISQLLIVVLFIVALKSGGIGLKNLYIQHLPWRHVVDCEIRVL